MNEIFHIPSDLNNQNKNIINLSYAKYIELPSKCSSKLKILRKKETQTCNSDPNYKDLVNINKDNDYTIFRKIEEQSSFNKFDNKDDITSFSNQTNILKRRNFIDNSNEERMLLQTNKLKEQENNKMNAANQLNFLSNEFLISNHLVNESQSISKLDFSKSQSFLSNLRNSQKHKRRQELIECKEESIQIKDDKNTISKFIIAKCFENKNNTKRAALINVRKKIKNTFLNTNKRKRINEINKNRIEDRLEEINNSNYENEFHSKNKKIIVCLICGLKCNNSYLFCEICDDSYHKECLKQNIEYNKFFIKEFNIVKCQKCLEIENKLPTKMIQTEITKYYKFESNVLDRIKPKCWKCKHAFKDFPYSIISNDEAVISCPSCRKIFHAFCYNDEFLINKQILCINCEEKNENSTYEKHENQSIFKYVKPMKTLESSSRIPDCSLEFIYMSYHKSYHKSYLKKSNTFFHSNQQLLKLPIINRNDPRIIENKNSLLAALKAQDLLFDDDQNYIFKNCP